MEKPACFFIWESFVFNDVIEEFSTWDKLHDQKQLAGSFDDFVELDNVGMPHNFEDLYFSHDSSDVSFILYFVFL